MNKACEAMVKRRVVLADGRYLIFYTFAESDSGAPSPAAAEKDGKDEPTPEEN